MRFFLIIISVFLFSCQSFNFKKTNINNDEILNNARMTAIASDYDEAISNYEKVITDQSSTELVLEFSKVLRTAKQPKKALEILEKHYNTNAESQNNAEVTQELGNAYMENGELAKAEELFFKTFTIDATNWKAAASLGLINGLQGDYNESRHYFDLALALSNDNYAVLNNYANIEKLASNNNKAKKLYKKALKNPLPKKVKQSIEKQIKEIK